MNKVEGNVCFFHRQSDDKWLWFIADEYGRALVKCVEPFNDYEEVQMDYNHHKNEILDRLQLENPADPFKKFFSKD